MSNNLHVVVGLVLILGMAITLVIGWIISNYRKKRVVSGNHAVYWNADKNCESE